MDVRDPTRGYKDRPGDRGQRDEGQVWYINNRIEKKYYVWTKTGINQTSKIYRGITYTLY